ncbi:MAG: glucosylceramidase [Polaribacter sp.]
MPRISSVSSSNKIISTAFKNKNDNIAIVAMNLGDETLDYSITIDLKTSRLKL